MVDYNPPTLCIRSITEIPDKPGKFMLDMPSLWFDDGPVEVSQETIDFIRYDPYQVVNCPPGYPNPPVADN